MILAAKMSLILRAYHYFFYQLDMDDRDTEFDQFQSFSSSRKKTILVANFIVDEDISLVMGQDISVDAAAGKDQIITKNLKRIESISNII